MRGEGGSPEYGVDDEERLWQVVGDHPFGTIVSAADGEAPLATLVPYLVQDAEGGRPRLWGHMGRANPQWRSFRADREVLNIFRGPDAYVSPSWYVNRPYVPTWNFVHVHVYGRPRLLGAGDDAAVRWLLEQTVDVYEAKLERPWRLDVPEAYLKSLMDRVATFEIEVTRMEGQFKLSQDKPEADRRALIARLAEMDAGGGRAVADLMERELEREAGAKAGRL